MASPSKLDDFLPTTEQDFSSAEAEAVVVVKAAAEHPPPPLVRKLFFVVKFISCFELVIFI